jgi:pimeloyl-ACP methyl ester carboxylesterase
MEGIKRIQCPVLIVHGTDDEVVSYQVRVFVTLFLPCVNPELALSQHGFEFHKARTRLQLPQVALLLLCFPSPAHIVYRNCFCRQAFIDLQS